MNENLELLAKTLESGEYDQTNGVLYHARGDGRAIGYCCLGVACDLFQKTTGEGSWSEPDDAGDCTFRADGGESDSTLFGLPTVQNFYGLDSEEFERMINYNDSFRKNFTDIASLIRQGFPKLEEND